MGGICSTGHPWLDGAPTCRCDALAGSTDGIRYLLEPLPDAPPKTVVSAHEPLARAKTLVAERPPAPILSDDGWWQWDGAAWVPADVPPARTEEPVAPHPIAQNPVALHPVDPQPVTLQPAALPPPAAADVLPSPVSGGGPPPGWAAPPPAGWAAAPPAYGHQPWRHRERDGLAVAALVCSLIPIFALMQLLAIVFAIVVLTRVGRTGKKGQVMAVCAIAVSVVMFFVSAAIAVPVFFSRATDRYDNESRSALRDAAVAEETFYTDHARYADAQELQRVWSVGPHDQIYVAVGPSVYCLAGQTTYTTGRWFWYGNETGGLSPVRYATHEGAIAACVAASGGVPAGGSGGSGSAGGTGSAGGIAA